MSDVLVREGERVFSEGAVADRLFFLLQARVRACARWRGALPLDAVELARRVPPA